MDYDTAVELVEQNYRNGNFDRAVVYSLSGTDQPDVAAENEKGPFADMFLNELGKVDPNHPLVADKLMTEFMLDEDEVAEGEVRKLKGHQGFL